MKLYSRLSGEILTIDPDTIITSGLYALTNSLGRSDKVGFPSVLLDDGTGKCVLDAQTILFNNFQQQQTEEEKIKFTAETSIIHDAVEHINDKYNERELRYFSHLLPPEIDQFITPTDLDKSIERAFENGVLQYIDLNPRMTMRYDVELLPTSRVKRYASNYQSHLVAHSECWQQRTFTGIVPKKLLGKVSEDEVKIYENIVYARLVDHLLRYLVGAQARLQRILDVIEKFGELDGKDRTHHHVYQITEDWGRAFKDSDANSLKEKSQQQLDFVTRYRIKLVQLRNSQLYRSIPRNIQVGITLKTTNILLHDDNYRRMASVWRQWSKLSANERLNPREVLNQKIEQQKQYSNYVAMIIKQIFSDIGWKLQDNDSHLTIGNGINLNFNNPEEGVWLLQHDDRVICRIVAVSEPLSSQFFDNKLPKSTLLNDTVEPLIVVTSQLITSNSEQPIVELSPLILEGKEALSRLIIKMSWQWALSLFTQSLPAKLPTLFKNSIANDRWLNTPLSKEQLALVNKMANPAHVKVINIKNALAKFVRHCPYCGDEANERLFTVNNGYFKGQCSNKNCQSIWLHEPQQQPSFMLNDGSDKHGRYAFSI